MFVGSIWCCLFVFSPLRGLSGEVCGRMGGPSSLFEPLRKIRCAGQLGGEDPSPSQLRKRHELWWHPCNNPSMQSFLPESSREKHRRHSALTMSVHIWKPTKSGGSAYFGPGFCLSTLPGWKKKTFFFPWFCGGQVQKGKSLWIIRCFVICLLY